jgi:hypothetical protein
MNPIKATAMLLCVAALTCAKASAQTKQETIDWIKSKLLAYAVPDAGQAANICFNTANSQMGVEYQDGSLVVNNLSNLNCANLSWVMDDNGPGTGSLQITGTGIGSMKYDCFWTQNPVSDSMEIDFDDCKVWVVNPDYRNGTKFCKQAERGYAKFIFNKDFFADPDLKSRFEKAIKHLIVLCGGNGNEKEAF